jgi:L-fucose isomerase-like protein
MNNALSTIFRRIASEICDETDCDELSRWLSELKQIGYDTNGILRLVGAKQNSRDITVRAIIRLINKANDKKRRALNKRINEIINATKLL